MSLVFLDTGAWIALLVPRDMYHVQARNYFRMLTSARSNRLLTSNYVLAETVTWLAYHQERDSALKLRAQVQAAESTRLLSTIWVSTALSDVAWQYFERYHDQALSFIDCTSFAVCQAQKVDTVFGFDQHFRVAGFDLQPKA